MITSLITDSTEILSSAGYETGLISTSRTQSLAFENDVCLGFLFAYDSSDTLLNRWISDSNEVIEKFTLSLRRADEKAWNIYLVLVSSGESDETCRAALSEIEESLVGTRKIVRSGINSTADLRTALLPLLPLQTAPKLDPIDMPAEIRMRAGDVSSKGIEAFLSNATDPALALIFENT